MEGIDMHESDDFCNSILSRYSNSTEENHQHLCAVIGPMSQELKDSSHPRRLLWRHVLFSRPLLVQDRAARPRARLPPHPPIHGPPSSLFRHFEEENRVRVGHCRSPRSDVSAIYKVLIDYVTDDHPKVRRQSHMCLRDALYSFQGTGVLAPASEAITNILKRLVVFACRSNAKCFRRAQAQEILYVLDALKDCLLLLSLKFSTSILTYFKSLFELRQPVVSRRITNSLNAICLHPNSKVSPEVLLDLLCVLGLSILANEMSADDMTFTARLLDVGMSKIYAFHRKIYIVELPFVFTALGDVLAVEHEEALFTAKEAFKNLIKACIDESLIKQGVDQIMTQTNVDARKSGPAIIEKVCATIESLFDYRDAAVWDILFQVASTMFDKLGILSMCMTFSVSVFSFVSTFSCYSGKRT